MAQCGTGLLLGTAVGLRHFREVLQKYDRASHPHCNRPKSRFVSSQIGGTNDSGKVPRER
jgi:hypothetical protein